jgi:hypothetical protein
MMYAVTTANKDLARLKLEHPKPDTPIAGRTYQKKINNGSQKPDMSEMRQRNDILQQ